ncbi:hypothetical protein [Providencia manganoxydans]|uniref:hypothetical protein n=1 Tax=Providencia manganoxydans TaxID=2923283 RepID=UPI00280CF56F|nr:hypothetical protein [Providencia stuartii]ELR5083135.1 hypothetical protein [Providencia stuartii]
MTRANDVIKYVEKRVNQTTRDVNDIEDLINEDFIESIEDVMHDNNENKYIDYMSILDFNASSIAMIYMFQLYKKVNKVFYTFERFFYHKNLNYILGYYDNYKRHKCFFNLAEQGEILLMDFACDDFRVGHLCYDKIIESIQSGKMAKSLPMYTRPQKLGVLAIEMLASEKEQTIDWESAGIPIDPFYQRFCQEALYTESHDVIEQWLITLCDRHIEWSALFAENENEQSSTGYEIDMEILLAWPFEYQAVKNFRAKHGLTTPVIDHPLLKTPMAIDHRPDMVGWKQNRPAIYNQIIDDLITINPELQVINKLF